LRANAFIARVGGSLFPGDQKIAGGAHADRGIRLVSSRRRVHAEIGAERCARRVESAREHAATATVTLRGVGPRDDEAACRIDADAGLVAGTVDGYLDGR